MWLRLLISEVTKPEYFTSGLHVQVRRREYIGVQALRAIAALGVVAYHGTTLWAQRMTSTPAASEWIAGSTGVDVFFVISGFVMMLTSQRLQSAGGAREFLIRRLIRIVPLYWLVTTIKLVGLLWSASLAVNSMPSWSEVLRSYCFIPYRHPDGNVTVLVIVGWTLVFEMFFYVIFAFGIATRRNKVQFLTVVMGLIGAIGLFRRPDWPVASFVVDPLVLEFLAGVYLAKLVMVRPRVLPRTVAWGVCLSWIIYLSLFSGWEDGRLRIFVAGIPAMLTVAAVVSLEDQLHRWIPGWLRTLGDASYSIYLVHGLVLPVLGVLMVRYGFFDRASAKATAVILSLVFSSFTGVFVYRICEYPLTEWLKGKARPRSRQEQLV